LFSVVDCIVCARCVCCKATMIPIRYDMPQGPVTLVMANKEKSVAGTHQNKVRAQDQAVVNRINKALESRVTFKARMRTLWVSATGPVGKADEKKLIKFIKKISRDIDVPTEVFGDANSDMDVYDFDGNGSLSFDEGYRMVKHSLAKHRKRLGGNPDIDVPVHTPEQGGFTFLKVLGKGGQGTAKLVKAEKNFFYCETGEEMVMKEYSKVEANAGDIDDLKEELEITAKVQHNLHIAHTYEIFQDETHFYLIQDAYLGGDFESLQKKAVDAGVDLDDDWYKQLFTQCFTALEFLHEHGIVHCDIKEANIMCRTADFEEPEIVIIDYGMAAFSLASDKGVCGTPGYIPPETWAYGSWYPKGDVFAMGVVCAQMLTGNVPNKDLGRAGIFQAGAKSMNDMIENTKTKRAPIDGLDEEIKEWLEGALDKEYHDRFKPIEVLRHDWFSDHYVEKGGSCHSCTVS